LSEAIEAWRARAATLRAIALLLLARGLIAAVPLRHWRSNLGQAKGRSDRRRTVRLAAQIERAAWRLPLATKCLPRAMALSWLLRREGLEHTLVLALRPPGQRESADALHAWIEVSGEIVLGELPGPWLVVQRLPQAD
jgi:aryl-alcohol dehydrogenase-like predicted oxidoreductase